MWMLAKDLERVAAASDDPTLKRLCEMLREHYAYPVSSHVLTIGDGGPGSVRHEAAQDVMTGMTWGGLGYVRFLLGPLGEDLSDWPQLDFSEAWYVDVEGAFDGDFEALVVPGHEHHPPSERLAGRLTLMPGTAPGTLLDVFESGRRTVHELDATAFAGGGTLEITVTVGGAEAAGSFLLFADGAPEPLAHAGPVLRGERGVVRLAFEEGAVLRLVATGAGEGGVNAFLAEVRVLR